MKIIIILVLITNIISCKQQKPTIGKSRTVQKEVRKIKEFKYSRYEIEKIEQEN